MHKCLSNKYKEVRSAGYHGLPEGIEKTHQAEGTTAGGGECSWVYEMGARPLIRKLVEVMSEEGLVKFLIDDGTFGANFDTLCRVVDLINSDGGKYGYVLNLNKGAYLLASTINFEEAVRRKEILIGKGLNPEVIHIHPNSVNECVALKEVCERTYGSKLLGSWLGTDLYIKTQLQKKCDELSVIATKLCELPDSQSRYLLFR